MSEKPRMKVRVTYSAGQVFLAIDVGGKRTLTAALFPISAYDLGLRLIEASTDSMLTTCESPEPEPEPKPKPKPKRKAKTS